MNRPLTNAGAWAKKAGGYLLLTLFGLWCLFPVYWMVITSIKPRIDTFAEPPIFFPLRYSADAFNYVFRVLVQPGILNSILVSTMSMFFVIIIGSMAGFGLSRIAFRGRKSLMSWILSLRMFPVVVVVIPIFAILRNLKLVDTLFALTFVYIGMNLPFTIWIMKTFFDEMPLEIEEAAHIDGCSRKGVFFRIALPLAVPGLIAAAIFAFIFAWNEFLFALILTRTKAVTAQVRLASLESTGGIDWDRIAALSAIIVVPVILFSAFIQKNIVRGLTFGAIKE